MRFIRISWLGFNRSWCMLRLADDGLWLLAEDPKGIEVYDVMDEALPVLARPGMDLPGSRTGGMLGCP